MISTYNALLPSNFYQSSEVVSFPLYHQVGDTFHVIAVQSNPNDSAFVSLIFIPIGGNEPNVTMDYNDTLCGLLTHMICIDGAGTFTNIDLEYSDTIIHVDFILSLPASNITSNYMVNSKNEAVDIFNQDMNVASIGQSLLQSQTAQQTSQTTSTQIGTTQTSSSSNQSVLLWLKEFWYVVVIVLGGVASLVTSLHYIYREMNPFRKSKPTKKEKQKQPQRNSGT